MAEKLVTEMMGLVPNMLTITSSFYPDGVNPPTGVTGRGIATVVRDDVGEFTVTLNTSHRTLISAKASMRHPTKATIADARVGAVSNLGTTSATTLKVFTYDIAGGAAADYPADPDISVDLTLVFNDSSSY